MTTLRARWMLTMGGPPIEGGLISFTDGRILDVGSKRGANGADVLDLGDVVLMPGLVNPHCHLEFSSLTTPLAAAGAALPEWIRRVIGERRRGDRDPAAAIAAGLAESLACGVTTIGEIATAPGSAYKTAEKSPRPVLLQEAIGFSSQRVDSALADVEQRLAASGDFDRGVSPHAPYTTNPRLVERLVALAADRKLPVAMHIAESREELQFLADGEGPFRGLLEERSMWDVSAVPRGSRPLDYLRLLADVGNVRSLVIHGNYLADDEIAFVGSHRERMSVVYCPRTHAYFGHAPYPLPKMRAAGVRMTLGTDSRASNPDLDLLAEARFAARLHAGVTPEEWLVMITRDAAVALGFDRKIGTLAAGKRADLVAFSCEAPDGSPYEAALQRGEKPVGVWLAGERVI